MRIFGDLEVSVDHDYENVLNSWTIGVCNTQFTENVVLSLFPRCVSLMYDKDRRRYVEEGTYIDSIGTKYGFSGYIFGDYSLLIHSTEKISFIRDGHEQIYVLVNEIAHTRTRELQYEMRE